MDKETILKEWLKQAQQVPAPTEQIYLLAMSRGQGKYNVREMKYRENATPPSIHRFLTDNLDEIVVWSVSPFINFYVAHEIAQQWGEQIGWCV